MLGAKDLVIVDNAVKETLEQIKKYAPDDYAKLEANSSQKDAIIKVAKAAATEQVNLSKDLVGQPQNIADLLAKHLPEQRIQLIQSGLQIPTFRMDIAKKDDGKHWVNITKENKALFETRVLASISDIDWATIKQWASIVVEAVMLVMSAVGISVSPGEHAINEAVDEAAHVIQTSSKFQKAIQAFVDAWNAAGASAYQKAKAIFSLIKDTYSAGILWTIIKSLCSKMSWLDWLETSAKVTAMIVAALATDGTALIAEVALIVLSAVDFARKISNLMQLETIKKSF